MCNANTTNEKGDRIYYSVRKKKHSEKQKNNHKEQIKRNPNRALSLIVFLQSNKYSLIYSRTPKKENSKEIEILK